MQVVHAEASDIAERISNVDHQAAVILEQGSEVSDRGFPPIHFAVLQRGGGGAWIGHHHPFDAVEQHALAAGEPRMRLLARCVIGEFFEYRPRAGKPFLAHEAHWPTADILGDRLERIGRRGPRRPDEAGWRYDFAV